MRKDLAEIRRLMVLIDAHFERMKRTLDLVESKELIAAVRADERGE